MPTDLYLNSNHDIELLNRDIRFTGADDEVKQRLAIILQFLLGEWFLNTNKGIPYTQIIFERSAQDIQKLSAYFRSVVKNTAGVEIVNSLTLDIDRDKRELVIDLRVNNNVTLEVTV